MLTGNSYDAVVVGGGPAGSISAMIMARAGLRVCVVERERHPRFHIGESVLPRAEQLFRELGLSDKIRKLPHLRKLGAEFGFGNDPATMKFWFRDGLIPGDPIFNIERSYLDSLLLEEARTAGAEICERTAVREIVSLADGAIEIATDAGNVRGRTLIDASGQSTLLGRRLKTRRNMSDPELQKVAYFQHFHGVEQLEGEAAGNPGIIMCDEGWFWLIGLTQEKTSVGFVTRPSIIREVNVAPSRLLRWAIARCPVVRDRMKKATGPEENEVIADFSYACHPAAGPGYFLAGDACCFFDPIFSAGVTMALLGAAEAAKQSIAMLRGNISPATARRNYIRYVNGSVETFWRLIRAYYRHSFRELFLEGRGPFEMHRAVIAVLAGQAIPRATWALRWRLELFHLCVRLQKYFSLVPRRRHFSLFSESPVETLCPQCPMPLAAAAIT